MEKKELLRAVNSTHRHCDKLFRAARQSKYIIMLILWIASQSLAITNDTKPELLIFVSSSMPISLLKNYYKEAFLFDGILVFKGLPNGSFQELSKLIAEITLENNPVGIIIDDESFERFGINQIPAFVLYKEDGCFAESSCKITYDKIIGNIGIKAALREFVGDGDMTIEASSRGTK